MSTLEERHEMLMQWITEAAAEVAVRVGDAPPSRPREIQVRWRGTRVSGDHQGQGGRANEWSVRIVEHALDSDARRWMLAEGIREALSGRRLADLASPMILAGERALKEHEGVEVIEQSWLEHLPREGSDPPVLATGHLQLGTPALPVGPGANAVVLLDGVDPAGLDVGDLVLRRMLPGPRMELLGRVVDRSENSATLDHLPYPLEGTEQLIALQQPTHLPCVPSHPIVRESATGLASAMALDGTPHRPWQGAPRQHWRLALDPILTVEAEGLGTLLRGNAATLRWFLDGTGVLHAAVIDGPIRATHRAGRISRLEFDLLVSSKEATLP